MVMLYCNYSTQRRSTSTR